MAQNPLGKTPFPLRIIDTDRPVALGDLSKLVQSLKGAVTLCIRSEKGHAERGGYFFHIQSVPGQANFEIVDFGKTAICQLDGGQLVRFVNHVSGRQFDEEMLTFCQQTVNLRKDQIAAEKEASA